MAVLQALGPSGPSTEDIISLSREALRRVTQNMAAGRPQSNGSERGRDRQKDRETESSRALEHVSKMGVSVSL